MPGATARPRPSKRDLLIDAALDLFHTNGYHATCIDEIVEGAGAAKMTLYSHFGSKDELLLAALDRLDCAIRVDLRQRMAAVAPDVERQLLVLFDVLAAFVGSGDFTGCFFVNIATEFVDRNHPVHRATAAHKQAVTDLLADVARAGGITAADELALQLMMVFNGAVVGAQVGGVDTSTTARRAAERLIADAVSQSDVGRGAPAVLG